MIHEPLTIVQKRKLNLQNGCSVSSFADFGFVGTEVFDFFLEDIVLRYLCFFIDLWFLWIKMKN